mgnify:CR=1 FL=1
MGRPRNGDLFAHFGVSLSPEAEEHVPPASVAPVKKVHPCHACGWLRALPSVGACPNCGVPPREAKA